MSKSLIERLADSQQRILAKTGPTGQTSLPELSGFDYAPPWVHPPPDFLAFDPVKAIATPALSAVDSVVLSFPVPQGWDGVIRGLSHNYSGGNLQQASGAIVWRVLIDGVAARNYDAMVAEFGSPQVPRPIWGIRIYGNQLVQYVVNLPLATGFIADAPSNIICGMQGWIYPRALA